jgi:hypothetical protein
VPPLREIRKAPLSVAGLPWEGPWLCEPVSRPGCPFGDGRGINLVKGCKDHTHFSNILSKAADLCVFQSVTGIRSPFGPVPAPLQVWFSYALVWRVCGTPGFGSGVSTWSSLRWNPSHLAMSPSLLTKEKGHPLKMGWPGFGGDGWDGLSYPFPALYAGFQACSARSVPESVPRKMGSWGKPSGAPLFARYAGRMELRARVIPS